MSRKEKLLSRLLSRPKDFTYNEIKALLILLGYKEDNVGKTSGSAVRFINDKNHIIRIHKPHPDNIVKSYIIKMVIEELLKEGFINE
ncbi:MAG: type II toxin-antitoxin system HicA family toxin [Tepidanaerobacteraceae bacterium]|nr:type II toxin-antitoxin system HicA family toxin [Tepidanaerobacteraceae bacterium]